MSMMALATPTNRTQHRHNPVFRSVLFSSSRGVIRTLSNF